MPKRYERKLTKAERGAPKVGPPRKSDRGPVRRDTQATNRQRSAFDDALESEGRESRARAVLAEDKARANRARSAKITRTGGGTGTHVDDVPPGSKRSGIPAPPRRRSSTMRDINRTLRHFGGGNPRRVLVAEMVAVLAIVTISEIADGNAPTPTNYVAPFVVYLALAFLAEFGDDAARLASGMGALVALALLVNHSAGLVKALSYVAGSTATGGPPRPPSHNRKGD